MSMQPKRCFKKVSFFSILLLIGTLVYLYVPPPLQAANFTIADGDVDGLIAAINAINASNQPGVINLAQYGTYVLTTPYNETLGSNGLPPISGQLVINGNSAIISRNSSSPYFRILFVSSTADLTINALRIVGGSVIVPDGNFESAGYGGAIFNNGGKLELNYTIISDSLASVGAGALYNASGGVVKTNQATIDYNKVVNAHPRGGGGVVNEGTMTLVSTSILSNQVSLHGTGGAILNYGLLKLISASITDNLVDLDGAVGGIRNYGTLNITNSTISGNKSGSPLGGAIVSGPNLAITGSDVIKNLEAGVRIIGTGSVPVSILGSNFSQNSGNGLSSESSVVIGNSDFRSNSGTGFILGKDASASMSNSFFSFNTGNGFDNGGSVIGNNLTFAHNSGAGLANSGTATLDISFISNNALNGINNGGILNLSNSTFLHNYTNAMYNSGSGNVLGSTFQNNVGPAIGNAGSLTVTNSTFTGNEEVSSSTIENSKSLTLIHSTVSTSNSGHALFTTGPVELHNTLLRTVSTTACSGSITNGSGNVEYPGPASCGAGSTVAITNPLLLSVVEVSDNGGPTQTIPLKLRPNPAVDSADPLYCTPLDQRGVRRPLGPGCDVGAFEDTGTPLLQTSLWPFAIVPGGTATLSFYLQNSNPSSLSNVSFNDTLPSQLTIVSPSSISSCGNGNGTIVANLGSSTISVSGITLAANQACTIEVKIMSNTFGTWSNTTGPVSATESGPGPTSNIVALKVLNSLVVTNTSDDQNNPVPGSLRQVLAVAGTQNGAIVTFDAALGTNPQITLVAPLSVPSNVLLEASCSNRIRINIGFANGIQLHGNTLLQGLDIRGSIRPVLRPDEHTNQFKCVSVST